MLIIFVVIHYFWGKTHKMLSTKYDKVFLWLFSKAVTDENLKIFAIRSTQTKRSFTVVGWGEERMCFCLLKNINFFIVQKWKIMFC